MSNSYIEKEIRMKNRKPRIVVASVTLGFFLPKVGALVPLAQATDVVDRISATLKALVDLTKNNLVEVGYGIRNGSHRHEKFSRRVGHSEYEISGGFIDSTPPSIAQIVIGIYDYDLRMVRDYKLPEPEYTERRLKREMEIVTAEKQVADILLRVLYNVGYPDMFITETSSNSRKILEYIYPEIKEMGKDIDGQSYEVTPVGRAEYEFIRH